MAGERWGERQRKNNKWMNERRFCFHELRKWTNMIFPAYFSLCLLIHIPTTTHTNDAFLKNYLQNPLSSVGSDKSLIFPAVDDHLCFLVSLSVPTGIARYHSSEWFLCSPRFSASYTFHDYAHAFSRNAPHHPLLHMVTMPIPAFVLTYPPFLKKEMLIVLHYVQHVMMQFWAAHRKSLFFALPLLCLLRSP